MDILNYCTALKDCFPCFNNLLQVFLEVKLNTFMDLANIFIHIAFKTYILSAHAFLGN